MRRPPRMQIGIWAGDREECERVCARVSGAVHLWSCVCSQFTLPLTGEPIFTSFTHFMNFENLSLFTSDARSSSPSLHLPLSSCPNKQTHTVHIHTPSSRLEPSLDVVVVGTCMHQHTMLSSLVVAVEGKRAHLTHDVDDCLISTTDAVLPWNHD